MHNRDGSIPSRFEPEVDKNAMTQRKCYVISVQHDAYKLHVDDRPPTITVGQLVAKLQQLDQSARVLIDIPRGKGGTGIISPTDPYVIT